jgi:hypothetical protein
MLKVHGETTFKGVEFANDAHFPNAVFHKDADFSRTVFKSNINFNHMSTKDMSFQESRFESKKTVEDENYIFLLKRGKFGIVNFSKATLEQDFIISESSFDGILFIDSRIRKEAEVEIRHAKINTFVLNKYVNESEKVIFDFVTIERNLVIKNVGFEHERFTQTDISKAKVEIENSSFNSNFFNSVKWGTITENRYKATRDIFRQLKAFSEQQKNFIDADGFYSLEMKEQKKELKRENKELKGFEKISHYLTNLAVFYIHEKTSNFSQNWLLPIYWLFILGMLGVIVSSDDLLNYLPWICPIVIVLLSAREIYKTFYEADEIPIWALYFAIAIPIVFLYSYITTDWLDDIAKRINPSKIFKPIEDSSNGNKNIFEFGLLVYKVAILFLVYQIIITVKKKVRSK